jgi:general stress protein 26
MSSIHPVRVWNVLLLMAFSAVVSIGFAQDSKWPQAKSDSLIVAAREIIGMQKYCALVTIDPTGRPNIRTMNPFPPEKDMTVWMATHSQSRKVSEIRHNSSVCLYYADHSRATGYVAITGRAYLVDDMQEKLNRKREYWTQAFPDWKYLLLIKVVPEKIEVINYRRNFNGESATGNLPTIEMRAQ